MMGILCDMLSSDNRVYIQVTSVVARVRLLYSALVLERAIIVCFLDHLDNKFGSRKIDVERL